MRIRRRFPQFVAAFVALATALNGRVSGEEGSRSFEITGSLGQDAPDIGGAGSARHLVYGVSVAYVYTARPTTPTGLVASGTLAYTHTTSDGDSLTAGKVGLDGYLMPQVKIGWRRDRLRFGLALDYRLDVAFVDATPEQALAASNPGYLTGFFFGPFVSARLGSAGTRAGRFGVDLGYQWGAGTRINAVGPDGFRRTVSLQGSHDAKVRVTYEATSNLVLGVTYQRTDYAAGVVFEDLNPRRPFDLRHRGVLFTIGLVSH